MRTATAIIAAFTVIFAFLIGAYSMFRISEHYNRIFRRIIEERTEDRVARDLFELPEEVPVQPKRPQPRPRKARPEQKAEVKADADN